MTNLTKHSNFMSSSECMVAVLWMNRNGHNVCGMHSESVLPGFFDFAKGQQQNQAK